MRSLLALSVMLSLGCILHAQDFRSNIIPRPLSMKAASGEFRLDGSTKVYFPAGDAEASGLAEGLSRRLSAASGLPVGTTPSPKGVHPPGAILLMLNQMPDTALGNEGYRLSVTPAAVTLKANRHAGLFYGIQSLYQLLPTLVEGGSNPGAKADWKIAAVEIVDKPRFGWRGIMLDVSRHFFTKDEVKRLIDEMVRYKYNVLHWHLTDDAGWRIEIKSYPNLTKKGAWSVRRTGTFGDFTPPEPGEKADYGGFYTQEEIREVVAYAKERYVDILPEIDVPGHSLAAIASYPELSCTPGADKYQVHSGEKIMNWGGGGHFTAIVDNTLCPANEKVYTFLDKVFGEVAALFPFEYIHMGGDECAKNFWEKSPQVKELMQREGLKNMDQVQSHFVKRVSNIIRSKGRKLIGWDEILEGGLASNAAVMSWRGMKGGIEAAKMGHEVVMTPNSHVYLDFMQGDRIMEPPVYATLRLKKTYEFEPVPAGVDPKWIKGGQGNLWTEQIYNERHLEYMLWPRSMSLAECLWSPASAKDWKDFTRRVEHHFERMDIRGVKYAVSMYDPGFTVKKDARDSILVSMDTELEGLDIHYSFDNSFPDRYYPRYDSPLSIPRDASVLKAVTYRDGRQVGRMMVMPVAELRRRAGQAKR
jgi:hexosaminidase